MPEEPRAGIQPEKYKQGYAHTVHGTEPCTDPECTIEREHGHSCPHCGPGTYIIVDLDD